MTYEEKVNRLGLDKVGFFVLLVAGIFCAKLLVSSRTNFKLSKPVYLEGTGVSAAIPRGGGFQQISDGFSYDDDEFRLGTVLRAGRQSAISVHWRYFLLPEKRSAGEQFAEDANSIGGTIKYSNTKKVGQLTFDCVKIVEPNSATALCIGSTVLPDGRSVRLEVVQRGQDFDMIDKIFNSVIATAEFKAENSRANGIKFMQKFRQSGFAEVVGKAQQNFYYIEDFTGRKLGFSTDSAGIVPDSSKAKSAVVAALYFFRSSMFARAEQDLFASEPNVHTFKWGNRQSDLLLNRETPTTIRLDETGTITVQKRPGARSFAAADSMLPEILFDYAIAGFLRSGFNTIMIDILLSDGVNRPMIIRKTKAQADKFPDLDITRQIEIKLFGGGIETQTIYLNDAGEMLLNEVRSAAAYRIRKTEKEKIIADFPDWSEKIEQIKEYTVVPDDGKKKRK